MINTITATKQNTEKTTDNMSNDISILSVGIDIGSTTAKIVITRNAEVIYEKYERHFSKVRNKLLEMLYDAREILENESFTVAISGSAGFGLAQSINLPFVQEVFVVGKVINALEPDTTTVIELGGEDAKIIFFDGGTDERMNGSCAGGTGAFIDQMASLLNITVDEMDKLALEHKKIYPIASRCGVFAKTDVQPLLNQGAAKSDIAASIFQAVVNQTIAGLAQGRKITGKVLFLGGPLYYCKGLQQRFKETLKLSDSQAVFPEYARYAVAFGTAIYARECADIRDFDGLCSDIEKSLNDKPIISALPPLFASEQDYEKFSQRHSKSDVPHRDISDYSGKSFLGIDCGSTTTKIVLLSENKEILYTYYSSNRGTPVEIIKEQLNEIYKLCGDRITIAGSAVTGYGEELVKNAFGVDIGVVETIAHYTAAKYFCPKVDFILDIGGQDIKCFKIKNGAIDSIMLNEACSSGCGSFIETFAKSMGYEVPDFAQQGLFAPAPVDLGSRCTVFMNSSVKQAQKDGVSVGDISAGLSISVVKNAIYKVIRATDVSELGENIIVQGGTFLNDAVLRAFERELNKNVIRPAISGLMGAYGCALISMKCTESSIITRKALENFTHTSKTAVCKGCTNHCTLTINTFEGGKKFISGNRCEKGLGSLSNAEVLPDLYEYKLNKLASYQGGSSKRGKIGLPMALGTYELLPLWYGIFTNLGFEVVLSGASTRRVYEKGQFTIPSDTACYPAKLMHGHIIKLMEEGVDAIFYPCLTYNVNEKSADNHYNCPVVAYYSELLSGNIDGLKETGFLYPYLNITSPKVLASGLRKSLCQKFGEIPAGEVKRAVKAGLEQYKNYMADIRKKGESAIEFAKKTGRRIMILAGRPYHIDSEICHGINKLATSLGFVVVSEDSICHLAKMPSVHVLNQWTYHSRLYRAAKYASQHSDVSLVQLVSFGCGVDAITTDEVRRILESNGKYYTQIKIDEITNLGAVKIRLRSLLGALEMNER